MQKNNLLISLLLNEMPFLSNEKIRFLLVVFCSCKKSSSVDLSASCNPLINYTTQIKPILICNCTSSNCHDGNSLPSLSDYNVAKDAVSRGIMPKNAVLSSFEKSSIICWIDNGAKNN